MSLARASLPDLSAARDAVRAGTASASALLEESLERAASAQARHAFVRLFEHQARATAAAADALRQAGAPLPALAGLAVSVKDLFDVHGFPTTAGSQVLADVAPAAADAPAVARLRAAGASLIGHANMTEFAFSGVGINPNWGTPSNNATLALDPTPRIPGGSTSGGAVSLACGAAWATLGSDTGGSIRIPAALQGLVGFKNTQRLTPLEGSVPLSSTLDTSCAITHSVRDAVLLHEVLANRRVQAVGRPLSAARLAVPTTVMLDDLEPVVARAFERTLGILRRAGATIEEIELPALARLAGLQAQGGFAAAESWAWHRPHIARAADRYDRRVLMRIRRGEAMAAGDYIELHEARRRWIAEVAATITGFDALLSPTVPMVAPALAPLIDDDDAFFAANARLLRNPSAINFLDGCALSLPCHASGELPVGLMVWHGALHDDSVLRVSLGVESAIAASRASQGS